MSLPKELIATYKKQGYHFVGRYGLVKPCRWLKISLKTRGERYCYKQKFYGVPSHRCLQASLYPGCTQRCLYCWRASATDLRIPWREIPPPDDLDEPEQLLDAMIEEHRRILSGYKGWPNIDLKMWEEARNPVHFTPSLVGEPTLYGAERLSRIFDYAFKKGFKTVFLVTNGTLPEVLESLDVLPSQLYISLSAPNEETYKKVCRPILPDGWNRVMHSIELLNSFNIPTVLRITLVEGYNMHSPELYAKIILRGEPTYVEVKAAMALGFFRMRLPVEAMPRHEKVKDFALKLAELTGYNVIDESLHSRVVLLSRLKSPIRLY
ncbi:MAG: 4-demethylwyosine synthase TYW1 [Thermoprotei archaeon]|nr:MAG: 4-demethylwyosine synthase TYW1 [Thermoprotei archaeon]RLF20922.1 MAG: 4-demethylwyosine synthase TYW1 [Thermoprotei archaeon]